MDFRLTTGDFMKNAGLIGFKKMLGEHCDNVIIKGNEIALDELLKLDLAQLYIDAYNHEFGDETSIAKAYKMIDKCIYEIEHDGDISSKLFLDNIKYISEKFTAASMKSGFESIKDDIEYADIYTSLCKNKIKTKDDPAIIAEKLKDLKKFSEQKLVKETFIFRGVTYSVINKFWDKKSFLLQTNSKKKAKLLIKNDFEIPFKEFLINGDSKPKLHCIECGMPISQKNASSISFLNDILDDLSRKPSAFWNFKPDAYICPICSFLYALAPLGFRKLGNDFVFINYNTSFDGLKIANAEKQAAEEKNTYQQYVNNALTELIKSNEKQISNIQVITRLSNENKYNFFVIDKSIMEILTDKNVKSALEKLCDSSSSQKDNKEYFNIYQACLTNIMNYRSQYTLINNLIRKSNTNLTWSAAKVLKVEAAISRGECSMDIINIMIEKAGRAGDSLAKTMVSIKAGRSGAVTADVREDITRGIVYQLTNALKVRNSAAFMDLLIRAYSSCKQEIPTVFMNALKNEDDFLKIGYAFVLGLKGAYYGKKTEELNND